MNTFLIQNNLELCLKDNVWDHFKLLQRANEFSAENGGILIGQLNPAEKQVLITDFTEAMKSDKRSRFHFFRSEKSHQKVMDDLWEESDFTKTYLGEWHTHDEDVPSPSSTDIREWKRICNRQYNSPDLFFIIVGKMEIGIWTIRHGIVTAVNGGNQ